MSLTGFIKKQFIDVLEWLEPDDGTLAWRYPVADNEIQHGASLTVRPAQAALFIDQGRIADCFGPGRYRLETATLPLLTNLRHWDKLFASPFKSDVHFFSTRRQLDRTWGTATPLSLRDREFGAVRLRAYGTYAYHVADPARFFTLVCGSRERYDREQLEGQLRSTLVAGLADVFAGSTLPFLDLAGNQAALAQALQARLAVAFAELGLALDGLVVENVSLPDELQKALDQRIAMGIVGDLASYTRYQVASSIPDAARNEGGLAALGAGLGVGQMFGQAVGAALPVAAGAVDEVAATLEKLHALVGKGVLTQAEFDAKKAELLKKLG